MRKGIDKEILRENQGEIFWNMGRGGAAARAARTNRAATVARTAKMGITLQNDLKLKFDKGIDKGTTKESQGDIFWNPARGIATPPQYTKTYKKQWFFCFFWSLILKTIQKTMFFLVFLVSGRLL